MTTTINELPTEPTERTGPTERVGFIRRNFPGWAPKVALGVATAIVLIAFLGPLFAPYRSAEIIGTPFQSPSSGLPLGTDYLGRDAWSRVLDGGWRVVSVAALATVFSYSLGTLLGLFAATSRPRLQNAVMRFVDLLLVFPSFLLILVVIAAIGPNFATILIVLGILGAPPVARIIYTAARETMTHEFVQAAFARGQSQFSVLRREVLPNLTVVMVSDAGPRFGYNLLTLAALGFLGVGLQPPTPDWAGLVSENLEGLRRNPWPVIIPSILIASLSVAVNVAGDAAARRHGISVRPGTSES